MKPVPGAEARARERRDRELFDLVALGDRRAAEELALRFMPLARSLAQRYAPSNHSREDIHQVAYLGLVNAINGFDAARGLAFTSYAVPTIVGEIKRYFRDRTWVIHVPRSLKELSMRADRVVDELTEQFHRQPSVAEIAAALGVSAEQTLEALQARGAMRAISTDAPQGVGDDDGATLGDATGIADDGFRLAEERARLAPLLRLLTQRERKVLLLRFADDMTQAEIGALIGVSQMQVSRIIRGALQRLRELAERQEQSAAPVA